MGDLSLRIGQSRTQRSQTHGHETKPTRGIQHRAGTSRSNHPRGRRTQQEIYHRHRQLHACHLRMLLGGVCDKGDNEGEFFRSVGGRSVGGFLKEFRSSGVQTIVLTQRSVGGRSVGV